MASQEKPITRKLFVGLGGSGAKTLIEIANLIAADKEWVNGCDSESCFLLVDMDLDDLCMHEDRIRATLSRVKSKAHVDRLPLSEGVPRMHRLITERLLVARSSREGLARMRESWWFNEKDEPFTAPNIQLPPSEGAGQCPSLSHFLAWNLMEGTDSKVDRVVERIHRAMAESVAERHGSSSAFGVKLFLVAGLAGGAGRGSWATVGFKIATSLEKKGCPVFPVGVFFDQSCFSHVTQSAQGQRVKMQVNSLTGISEVTGWIENASERNKDNRYLFRLPSFTSPDRPEADVIRVDSRPGHDSGSAASPIQQAYFLFGESDAGALAADQHCKVAAAAIHGSIANQLDNSRPFVGSLGASMYRINAGLICTFLAKRLEYEAASRLVCFDATVSPEAIVDRILLPLTAMDADRNTGMTIESAGRGAPHFLARLNAAILAARGGRISALVDGMDAMGKDERNRAIEALGKFDPPDDELVREVAAAVRKSIQHVFREALDPGADVAPGALLEDHVRKAMGSTLPDPHHEAGAGCSSHRQSLAVARAVLEALRSKLSLLPTRIAPKRLTTSPGDAVAEIEKRLGRVTASESKRLTESEKAEIGAILQTMVLEQGQVALQGLFESWCEPLLASLPSWVQGIEDGIERTKAHADRVAKEVGGDKLEELFTVEKDFEKSRRSLHGSLDAGFNPEAQLKPFASDVVLGSWVEDLLHQQDHRLALALEEIASTVLEHAYSRAGTGQCDERVRMEFKRNLTRMLDGLGGNLVVPAEFMKARFGLAQVAERLVREWALRIDLADADLAAQRNMERKFLQTFGFELKVLHGRRVVPGRKEILERMALRLGQNCRAHYIARETGASRRPKVRTMVFLPTGPGLVESGTAAKEWRQHLDQLAREMGAPVSFQLGQEGDQHPEGAFHGNPFLLLAAVTEGFPRQGTMPGAASEESAPIAYDQVSSLDYWRAVNDPHVKTFLEWVEDPNGKSMFAEVSYSSGLGYILPAFVTNKAMREARWRPWAKKS